MTASSPNRKSLKNSVTEIEERFELTNEQIDFINKQGLIKLSGKLIAELNDAINGHINFHKRYEEAPLRQDEYNYLENFASSTTDMLSILDTEQSDQKAYNKARARINRHLTKMSDQTYYEERSDLFRHEESQRGEHISVCELRVLSRLMDKRSEFFDPLICLENIRFELNFVRIAVENAMNDFKTENQHLEDTGADLTRDEFFKKISYIYKKALKNSKRVKGQWPGFISAVNQAMPKDVSIDIPDGYTSSYKTKDRAIKK